MLAPDGGPAAIGDITLAFAIAAFGTAAFAIGLAGYHFGTISKRGRLLYFLAAGLLLFPGNTTLWEGFALPIHDFGGAILFVVLSVINFRSGKRESAGAAAAG